MLNSEQIQNTLVFPFRDKESQKNFLIASLVMLAGFVIPVLPWLALYGYIVCVMRQIINEKQEPSMPEWTNWEELFKDGLGFLAIRMVITIPLLLVVGLGIVISALPIVLITVMPESSDTSALFSIIFLAANLLWLALLMVIALITIPLTVLVGAAEGHMASQHSVSAAFRIKEWWPIFRKNMGGFIISYLILSAISVVGTLAMQMLAYTIVLMCLLPFLLAPYSAYIMLTMYAFFAQAYARGRDVLQESTSA